MLSRKQIRSLRERVGRSYGSPAETEHATRLIAFTGITRSLFWDYRAKLSPAAGAAWRGTLHCGVLSPDALHLPLQLLPLALFPSLASSKIFSLPTASAPRCLLRKRLPVQLRLSLRLPPHRFGCKEFHAHYCNPPNLTLFALLRICRDLFVVNVLGRSMHPSPALLNLDLDRCRALKQWELGPTWTRGADSGARNLR